MLTRTKSCLAIAVLGGFFAMPASAAVTWQFATGSSAVSPVSSPASVAHCGAAATTTYGNCETWHATPSSGNPDVNVRAYSGTGSSGTIETAYLQWYSGGLGVTNRQEGGSSNPPSTTSPSHAIDNYTGGVTDSVLLSFKSTVNLTGILLGWPTDLGTQCDALLGAAGSCDTDISIWAYTGGGTPNLTSPSQTYGTLAAGWVMVGSYSNVPVGSNQLVNNAPNLDTGGTYTSQYWLVSAYYGSAMTNNNDFVKLQAVFGVVPRVSEPESLALLLIGLIGGVWVRRAKAS